MGSDKAFLLHDGEAFISAIAAQTLRVSDDVVVMTGKKDVRRFKSLLDERIRVFEDATYHSNPLGGIVSGLNHVKNDHAALLACDTPLVKADVLRQLYDLQGRHDAAVPIWNREAVSSMEPLCAVYRVRPAEKAAAAALRGARKSVTQMVTLMRDVLYVDVSLLRKSDPTLESLVDVNTREEYAALGRRPLTPTPVSSAHGARRPRR